MQKAGRFLGAGAIALFTVACASTDPSGLDFSDTGVLTSGFTATGVSFSGQQVDEQFTFLYSNDRAPLPGEQSCFTNGHCGLAGVTDRFGNMTPVPPDSLLLFVSTANLENDEVVVLSSGIVTKQLSIADGTQYDSLRASFEWAMLTSRLTPGTHNDSIVIRVRTDTDSATLFKVTSADLQSDAASRKPGGCGEYAVIVDRPIAYPHCTDWTRATLDLTPYRTRTFALEFIVFEGGQSPQDTVDEPSAFLIRALKVEGGK